MFERFTADARQAVHLALSEARVLALTASAPSICCSGWRMAGPARRPRHCARKVSTRLR